MKCSHCGSGLLLGEQFCGECGAPRPRLPRRFEETEKQFAALKARHAAQELGEAEYNDALKRLVLQDEAGTHWMIGAETGQWYRFDAPNWVRADPTTAAPAKPIPTAPTTVAPQVLSWKGIVAISGCLFILAAILLGAWAITALPALVTTPPSVARAPIIPPPTSAPIVALTPAPSLPPVSMTAPPRVPPTPTPLPPSTRGPLIAFVMDRDADKQIYVMNADGSGAKRLTNRPGELWHPVWSPDGNKIAFASETEQSLNDLYVMNRDGSSIRRITSFRKEELGGAGGVLRSTWSPDGNRIAFSADTSGPTMATYLYIVNMDGSGLKRITQGRDPTWSPDGQRIAYSGWTNSGANEIYTCKPDGTDNRQLTNENSHLLYPAWSPDAKSIALELYTSELSSVRVLDVATGKSRVLVTKPSTGLSWSPDGKKLLYAPAGGGIWMVSVDNPSDNKQISPDGTMPAWSP
jgi:dipeptidyl aminopeptidase/acylaminoacyl peptidase